MLDAEVEITGLGRDGEGVGRHGGLVVFVPGAVPGDVCRVAYDAGRRRMARARLLEVVRPSPDRVAPPCPAFGACGGCQLQAIGYDAELREKARTVQDALRRIGRLDVEVPQCIGSPEPYGYRAKVSWPVRAQDGELRIGLYALGTNRIVEEDSCAVAHPALCVLPALLRAAMRELCIPAYDGRAGLVRHAVARRARSGEILVTLVATREDPRLALLAERLMREVGELVGVALSLNRETGSRILGEGARLLAGRGEIAEDVLGMTFRIGATSFFQVHPDQAERLFAKVVEFAGPGKGRAALDLFTGVGVVAILLARAGYDVTGVEYVGEAVELARRNADENGIDARFSIGDAEAATLPRGDALVTLDPPRSGAPKLSRRLAAAGPRRVIYVSCDPATLARDARTLVEGGYGLRRVQPFDLFPRTSHVETVAEFVREGDGA